MRETTRPTKILLPAVATLALGCLGPPAGDSLGRLCAAPPGIDEHCVGSDQSPADAWKKAEAKGAMPIAMWAEPPRSWTFNELVASRAKLRAWFADIDRVTSYVRDTQKNAESYRETLSGRLGSLLRSAGGHQANRLARKPVDAVGAFTKAVTDKASAEKGPLLAAIATDKQSMGAARVVFEKAKDDAAPLRSRYAGLVTRFGDYRATEAAETAAYAALSRRAPALDAVGGVEQAILAAARAASSAPNELAMDVMTLSAELQAFAGSYEDAIAPRADFLATHGAALPDMTSGALRSLNAMLGYIERRVSRSDATATSLLRQIAMRRQALVLLQADQRTRDAVAQVRLRKASSIFSEGASARVEAIETTPKASTRLKLPYLAARRDQLTALLQLRPLCGASSSSWREAGCASLRGRFGAAETYLTTTLPRLIATGVATMRASGVETTSLDAAQARLDAGDIEGAAIAYDAAVRASEGT